MKKQIMCARTEYEKTTSLKGNRTYEWMTQMVVLGYFQRDFLHEKA
jgi:hypothetical protein